MKKSPKEHPYTISWSPGNRVQSCLWRHFSPLPQGEKWRHYFLSSYEWLSQKKMVKYPELRRLRRWRLRFLALSNAPQMRTDVNKESLQGAIRQTNTHWKHLWHEDQNRIIIITWTRLETFLQFLSFRRQWVEALWRRTQEFFHFFFAYFPRRR